MLPPRWPSAILKSMGATKTEDSNERMYDVTMGSWVTARCLKRSADHNIPMPDYVKLWLDEGGNSAPGPNDVAPVAVLEWLNKTIRDPTWPPE